MRYDKSPVAVQWEEPIREALRGTKGFPWQLTAMLALLDVTWEVIALEQDVDAELKVAS